ncbi:hypothetical protein ACOMHN_037378 [Nucella lapillus]
MLSLAKPPVTKDILKDASPDLVRVICECCLNVLKGNVALPPRQKKTLSKYKQALRTLTRKNTPAKTKQRLLQKGDFIQHLLKPIIAVLSSVL